MEFCNLYLEIVLTNVMLQVEKFLHCFHLSRLVEILSSKQFWKLFFYLHTFISFLPQILWQTILLARYHRWQNSWQTQLYQRMRRFSFALTPRKEILKGFICNDWLIHTSKYCWMPKWIWTFSSYNFLCSTVGCWTRWELLVPL